MKPRRRFNERDVIRTLIGQGTVIRCFRSGVQITLENVGRVQREHLHERELDGPDEPENCRYSLAEEHSIITNGTKATSAGSSKNRIAKARRSGVKMRVSKRAPGEPKPKSAWTGKSRPFSRANDRNRKS